MARVVLATLPGALGVQKLVVIKEMLPELVADPDFVAMFVDEARLAIRLDHPNLIQTFEIGESDGQYFIVMEYLDGQPLTAVLSRSKQRVPLEIQLHVLTRILAGLHYAHELTDLAGQPLGVVHRDVSPGNIFVCYGGVIKLVDFGIAKAVGARAKTRTGVFKGKLGYASPEQIEAGVGVVDRRTDVFAVGVLLWEAIVGKRLTADLTEAGILRKRLLGLDPNVMELKPDTPPELAEICRRAMAQQPSDRYATAAEMQAALEAYMEKAGMRVADRDVGAYVHDLFDKERTETRKLIQERLEMPSGDPMPSGRLILPQALSSRSLSETSQTGDAATVSAPTTRGALTAAPRRRLATAVVGTAVALAAFGLVIVFGMVRHKNAATRPSAAQPSAAPSPAAAPSTAQPASAPTSATSARTIELSFSADPPAARFSLDGRPLEGNPLRLHFPPDQQPHALRVTAPDRVPEERSIVFDRDVHLELALRARPITTPPVVRTTTHAPSTSAPPVTTVKPLDTSDPWGQK